MRASLLKAGQDPSWVFWIAYTARFPDDEAVVSSDEDLFSAIKQEGESLIRQVANQIASMTFNKIG